MVVIYIKINIYFSRNQEKEPIMRHKRDQKALSPEERARLEGKYKEVLSHPMWTFVRDSVRIIRPYSTKDFVRDYFIPNL